MGLSVIRFSTHEGSDPCWGFLEMDRVYRLPWEDQQLVTIVENLESRRAQALANAQDTGLALSEVTLLSPLTSDCALICQGLNYAQHQAEAGLAQKDIRPEDNLIFAKSSASLCGARDDIIRPAECDLLDYEAELGLVIRRTIDAPVSLTAESLGDYVAGFVICNDVSARDQQIGAPGMQWFKGKSYRTFCPAGPVLYLLDEGEIEYLERLNISLQVNGEVRQQASTAQLLHKPHDTLSYLSRFSNLRPGDCLLTGTPGGVALEMDTKTGLAILLNMRRDRRRKQKFRQAQLHRKAYLQDGDVVELQISSDDDVISLGEQRNTVVAEGAVVSSAG